MLLLASTSDKLQVQTLTAADVDVHASFVDYDGTTVTPGRTNTKITTATTTDVVASPGASIRRNVKALTVVNVDTVDTVTVVVKHTDGTTVVELKRATLAPNEKLHYFDEPGFDAGSGAAGAPTSAEYLVGVADGTLTAERVVTDTATVAWDLATAGQAKANVPNDAITYAKIQNVSATDRLLGRDTVGAGDIEELTPAAVLAMLAAFSGINLQVFLTGAGTYTPTANMKSCLVISTGGGGGGGGADTAGGSADVGVGGGGGAGATCIQAFDAATIGASQSLSVGASGTAGSTSGGSGGNGGSTTFGTTPFHTAGGGTGGTGSGASAVDSQRSVGGVGGVATGGAANINGPSGGTGIAGSADGTIDLSFGIAGAGGPSFWGGAGVCAGHVTNVLTTDASAAGVDNGFVIAPGCGGGGAVVLNSTTGVLGASGTGGIILVLEFK